MEKRPIQWVAITALVALSGCSTFSAATYTSSNDQRQPLPVNADGGVQVGDFQAGPGNVSEIMCRRVGPVKPPNGATFTEYIRAALSEEFQSPKVLPTAKPIILTGKVDVIDFSTVDDYWSIKVTLRSNNGAEATFSTIHSYRASWYGNKACEQAAEALAPAVRKLASEIRQSSEFRKLVVGAP